MCGVYVCVCVCVCVCVWTDTITRIMNILHANNRGVQGHEVTINNNERKTSIDHDDNFGVDLTTDTTSNMNTLLTRALEKQTQPLLLQSRNSEAYTKKEIL
jgi:hypothetical protein